MFAIISKVTFAIPIVVPVATDELFPVLVSLLEVVIFALFTKVHQELYVTQSVPVTTKLHPLPAGKVPRVNVVVGIMIPVGTISVMTMLSADLPQLFP